MRNHHLLPHRPSRQVVCIAAPGMAQIRRRASRTADSVFVVCAYSPLAYS